MPNLPRFALAAALVAASLFIGACRDHDVQINGGKVQHASFARRDATRALGPNDIRVATTDSMLEVALIGDSVIAGLGPAARGKTYLGYSDGGTLLGALYAAGIGQVAHGPMPADIRRDGGEVAVVRALDWLVDGDPSALEPSLGEGPAAAAFNIVILAHLAGSRHLPDLAGHVLMIEEVDEYLYRTDRDLAQIMAAVKGLAGIRLGRISKVPANDPDFGATPEAVVRD